MYLCARFCNGGLAQLARALAWHARGHRFESGILHHFKSPVLNQDKAFFICLFSFQHLTVMTLEERINADIPVFMKSGDKKALEGARAIKAAILLAKTESAAQPIDAAREVQILQKLIKSRQESLDIYEKSNRHDLAQKERDQIEAIRPYLPAMLEGEALETIIRQIIAEAGATSAKDMGKVMGMATKQLAGKAEGRAISDMVKKCLA